MLFALVLCDLLCYVSFLFSHVIFEIKRDIECKVGLYKLVYIYFDKDIYWFHGVEN
jgi:hypothetical protein